MPQVVPPPTPGTPGHESAAGDRPPPLDPALFEPEAASVEGPPAEPVKSRIGIAQVGRILRRTPPPLVDPRPDVASERNRPVPPPPAEAPEPQSIVPPSLLSTGAPRPIDPAALSDMTRRLETALRRQSSAVTPPPDPSAPAAEVPQPMPAPPPAASPPVFTEPLVTTASARLNPAFPIGRANAVPPSTEPAPRRDPVPAAVVPAPVPPPPAPEPAPEPNPALTSGGTAFTVEEIETEFARLLGRPLDRKT